MTGVAEEQYSVHTVLFMLGRFMRTRDDIMNVTNAGVLVQKNYREYHETYVTDVV